MIRTIIFWVSIFSGVLAFGTCAADSSEKTSNIVKAEEGALVEKYLSDIISTPKTQDDLDRNLIVNFLIDSLWDFRKTASGIYYQIDNPEVGRTPSVNDFVVCHYRGKLLDGREFDSSYKKGRPFVFKPKEMIAGWQEIIPMLKPGGKGIFLIPSKLAYGPQEFPGSIIKANAVLLFEIELIEIK